MVATVGEGVRLRPRRRNVVTLRDALKVPRVHLHDVDHLLLAHGLLEADAELLHLVGDRDIVCCITYLIN